MHITIHDTDALAGILSHVTVEKIVAVVWAFVQKYYDQTETVPWAHSDYTEEIHIAFRNNMPSYYGWTIPVFNGKGVVVCVEFPTDPNLSLVMGVLAHEFMHVLLRVLPEESTEEHEDICDAVAEAMFDDMRKLTA